MGIKSLAALAALALVACSPGDDRYDVRIQSIQTPVVDFNGKDTFSPVSAAITLDRRSGHVSVCWLHGGEGCTDLQLKNTPKGGAWRFVPSSVALGKPDFLIVSAGDPFAFQAWTLHNPSGRVAHFLCAAKPLRKGPAGPFALQCTADTDGGRLVHPPPP